MADEIIDISRYFRREAEEDVLPRSIALWGVDGDRSRFALPLWRVVHLAGGDRGVIMWRSTSAESGPRPFVVVDLASEPARLGLGGVSVGSCDAAEGPTLYDLGADGLVVFLGSRDERIWCLLADGIDARRPPLDPKKREDILFLAGECAGLLFLRDFADETDDP